MSREDTERRLEEAALTLLEQEGVLAGLNLREAADKADVNRGIVYHYFGSRRHLLQSALRRQLAENQPGVVHEMQLPLVERLGWSMRYMQNQERAIRLAALLALDGDPELVVLPFRDQTVARLRDEQDAGLIADDVDVNALNVFLASVMRGYVVHRNYLAAESGTSVAELDDKIEQLTRRFATSLLATETADEVTDQVL